MSVSTFLPQVRELRLGDRVKVRIGKRGEYTTSAFMTVIEIWPPANFVTENTEVHHVRHIRAWKGTVTSSQHRILDQINERVLRAHIAMGGFTK